MTMRDIVIEKLAHSWEQTGAPKEHNKMVYALAIEHYAQLSDEHLIGELENDAYQRGVDDMARY